MLGDVNKLFVYRCLLTIPGNALLLHLKQTFLSIIWIFTEVEGDRIESRLPFKVFSTLLKLVYFVFHIFFSFFSVSPIVVPNVKLYIHTPHRQIQSQTHIKVRTTTHGEQNGMSHITTSTGLVPPELRVRPRLLTIAEAAGRPIWYFFFHFFIYVLFVG